MRWQRALFGLAAFAVAACGAVTPSAAEDKPAAVELKDAKAADLAKAVEDAKGKVVLVDFWALWCGPCVKKFPALVEMHKTYEGKGLRVVSVCMEAMDGDPVTPEKREKMLAFLKAKGAAFPNFVVPDHKAAAEGMKAKFAFGMDSLPYMAVFARDGSRVWDSDTHTLKAEKFPTEKDIAEVVERELAK